jgi:hypothetical protein
MKAIHWTIAAAALAFVQPAPASAAQSDPEVIIYRFPGVKDSGTALEGVATVFFCTNFSGVNETIRFVTRASFSSLASNVTAGIGHLSTIAIYAPHCCLRWSRPEYKCDYSGDDCNCGDIDQHRLHGDDHRCSKSET